MSGGVERVVAEGAWKEKVEVCGRKEATSTCHV